MESKSRRGTAIDAKMRLNPNHVPGGPDTVQWHSGGSWHGTDCPSARTRYQQVIFFATCAKEERNSCPAKLGKQTAGP